MVNEDDQVIDVKTRGKIHAQGLMHRSVHILVFNSRGELFIQKRSMSKDNDPGLWDSSAAGHVNSGEEYHDCAVRELVEELGIAAPLQLEALFKLAARAVTGMEHCVIYRTVNEGPFQLQTEEIDEGTWVRATEMDRRLNQGDSSMTRILRFIWEKYRRDY